MGQAANVTNNDALDTVITNALIVDAVAGIVKADVGIKVCQLVQVQHITELSKTSELNCL